MWEYVKDRFDRFIKDSMLGLSFGSWMNGGRGLGREVSLEKKDLMLFCGNWFWGDIGIFWKVYSIDFSL